MIILSAADTSLKNLLAVAAGAAGTDKDVERRLRLWMADCAAHMLHVFEQGFPGDHNLRRAIEVARVSARRGATAAEWIAIWSDARDAVRDTAWHAPWDVAWAAIWAARPSGMAAAWASAWAAAWSGAWYAPWAAAENARAARDAEKQWQLDRLVAWLSDDEPADYPMGAPKGAIKS